MYVAFLLQFHPMDPYQTLARSLLDSFHSIYSTTLLLSLQLSLSAIKCHFSALIPLQFS